MKKEQAAAAAQDQCDEPALVPASHQAALHAAAVALGIGGEAADNFALTGHLNLGDAALLLQPRTDVPGDDWLALTRLDKPAHVDDARWCEALLAANGSMMLLGRWGFALDEDDAAVLVQRIASADCADARMLSAHLYGSLCLVRALIEGLRREPSLAQNVLARADDEAQTARISDEIKREPVFAPVLQALLADTVDALGCDVEALKTLLAGASLELNGMCLNISADPQGRCFTIAAALGDPVFGTPRRVREVLARNLELVSLAGLVAGRVAGQASLVGRYCATDHSGDDFAAWLQSFAAIAAAASRAR